MNVNFIMFTAKAAPKIKQLSWPIVRRFFRSIVFSTSSSISSRGRRRRKVISISGDIFTPLHSQRVGE
jgi:hypothetical protein